jgi:hypothetical protein
MEAFEQPLDKLRDKLEFKWGRVVMTQVTIHPKPSFWSLKFLLNEIP